MEERVLKAGNLVAHPGQRTTGYLDVPGIGLKLPVTLLCGKNTGKFVVITGGTHGAEFLGVEVAMRLARELDPEKLCGSIAIVHPANVPQFFAKIAYVGPFDGKNLNRVYPGTPSGTVSERIAYVISSELLRFADFYIDLHSGDIHETMVHYVIHSLLGTEETNRISAEAASLWGAKYQVLSSGSTGALGWAATQGIPGCLPEIGEGARWTEPEVKFYKQGALNVLSYLGVISDPIVDLGRTEALKPMDVIMCDTTGCWYPNFKPGDTVEKGMCVGQIRDFFGNVLKEYFAPKSGHVLFECSSLSLNEGNPVIGIG